MCSLVMAGRTLLGDQQRWPGPVLTHHNDNHRSGVNPAERTLNPATVGSLHNIGQFRVDGQVYAQPLFVPAVRISGKSRKVIFIATMRNYLYAYDADSANPDAEKPLWQVGPEDLGDPVPYNFMRLQWDTLGYNVHDSFGITSTPIIDEQESAIWVVNKALRPPTSGAGASRTTYWLHKLSLIDGHPLRERVEIVAQVAGTGDRSRDGTLVFDPDLHLQRAALLLANGSVYVGFGSHQDTPGFHGWLFRFNADDLSLRSVVCTTPDGKEGGVWQAGAGPAADMRGNVYVMTGNGTFNIHGGRHDYGMSFLRFTPDLTIVSALSPTSRSPFKSRWFLNEADVDLGASGPALVSDSLLVGGGKQGKLFSVASSQASLEKRDALQVTPAFGPPFLFYPPLGYYHIHGVPVTWATPTANFVFVWPEKTPLTRLRVNATTGQLAIDCVAPSHSCRSGETAPPHSMPGGMLSLTMDDTDVTSAVLWASLPLNKDAFTADVPGVLYAFNPLDLEHAIWTNQNDGRNRYLFAKYCPPTVANGRVYLATFSGGVVVYAP
jgi:hypothetical protein